MLIANVNPYVWESWEEYIRFKAFFAPSEEILAFKEQTKSRFNRYSLFSELFEFALNIGNFVCFRRTKSGE